MKKFLVLLVSVVCLFANTKTTDKSGRPWQIVIHNINQVEMCVSNYGKFGQDEASNAGCLWPKGSNHAYIFGAGYWFGVVDSSTGDTLVTVGYDPHDGTNECVPGLQGMATTHPNAIIYMYPDNWPAPVDTFPMAPQDHLSDQDSWCCFNDCDSLSHAPFDTRPIGIEVYQTVYAWNEPEVEDVIFFKLEFKNVSDHNLKNCYVGVVTDCDIGDALDDVCTGIVEKPYFIDDNLYIVDNLGYQWNWDDNDPTWGAIGFDLLQTPFDLQIGQDKDNDGILDQYERDSAYYWDNLPISKWDVDNDGVPDWRDASENPQLEMTALKRFTLDTDPSIDPERYMILAGYNFQTGLYEPYDTVIPPPDDQRFSLSSGPFDISVDSIITVVFAVVLADFGADATPAAESCLVLADHLAQIQYDMNWLYAVAETPTSQILKTNLAVCPNPSAVNTKISYALAKSGAVSIKLYNTLGQLIKEVFNGYKASGNCTVDLNTRGLAQGTYFLVLESPNGKMSRSLVVLH